jgi:hypothetical protein
MQFKTAVDQIAVVDGRRVDQAAGIVAAGAGSARANGRGQGSLYVLVEVSGEPAGRDLVAAELANCVCDAYYQQRRSVTAGLQEAVREANTILLDQNQQALRVEQRTAGISCAVLRENDLFIAQAGPAAIYLAHEGRVIRFPETSPWLDNIPSAEMEAVALGQRRQVRVDLFHTQVTEGDTVLLVEGSVARRIPRKAWYQILLAPSPAQVLAALVAAGSGGDLSACVLRLGSSRADRAVSPATLAVPAAAAGRPVIRPAKAPARTEADRAATAPAPAPIGTGAAGPPGQRDEAALDAEPTHAARAPQAGKPRRTLKGVLTATAAGLLAFLKQLAPSPSPPEPPPAAEPRPTRVVVSADVKKTPQRQAARRSPSRGGPWQKLILLIALAIPLVAAGIVVYTVVEHGQARIAESEELWARAQDRFSQAQSTGDPATVRTLLGEAQQALDQLLEEQPDNLQAVELQKRIISRLDEANQVRRVPWGSALASYPAGAEPSRVAVNGVHLFVLDRNADVVYHHQMDEFKQALQPDTEGRVVMRKGDQVGNLLVGDLVDMAWMPVGNGRQKAGLVVLDSSGSLVDYNPNSGEKTASRVAGNETWKYPQLVGSHTGRLYLLDSGDNEIWRYGPTAKGYTAAPDRWLQADQDLAGVQDMAVSDSIYLLYADGTIRRLTAGVQDVFDLSSWDIQPKGPTAIFAQPPNGSQRVYVADVGNARIVQSTADGRLERQYRLADPEGASGADPLRSVASLYVDDIDQRAYFLSGQELYMIILPE